VLLVLKRLSDALADGDRVLAVIRGSAVTQDGRSAGLTAPNLRAQERVIRQALDAAGLAPEQIGYVEAHGTGTALGDPIEMEALRSVLGEPGADGRPCWVGSVKTNLGHLEAASGATGLLKAALALEREAIPAHLHLQTLNPHIDLDGSRIAIPQRLQEWKRGDLPRFAAVSSFGLSGTNVHLVLEEAPRSPRREGETGEGGGQPARILLLSARSQPALRSLAARYEEWLREAPDATRLDDLCFTSALRRSHHEERLALVGRTRSELVEQLEAFARDQLRPGLCSGRASPRQRRRVVFAFPGQGSQWTGMGQDLLAVEPVFRERLEACDAAIRALAGWSVLDEIGAVGDGDKLASVDRIQPAIFAIQVALAELWRSWGVQPDAVVGHSLGEVAAAHVAGALCLEDAARVICERSRLVRSRAGQGAMAVAELGYDEAVARVEAFAGRLSVASRTTRRSVILSGDPEALDELLEALAREEIFARRVNVDYASHSAQMDPLLHDLRRALQPIRARDGEIPIFSTVTGAREEGSLFAGAYWARNLREPVLFWNAVEALEASGRDLFLEISPHPVLLASLREGLEAAGCGGDVVASLRRDEPGRQSLYAALGQLHCLGVAIDWPKIQARSRRFVPAPRYPWQRERYWPSGAGGAGVGLPAAAGSAAVRESHPLLGVHVASALERGTHYWVNALSRDRSAWLAEHRVGGECVLPGTAYAEMARAAASQVHGEGPVAVEQLRYERAFVLPEGVRHVQTVLTPELQGRVSVRILGRADEEDDWTLHASASVRVGAAAHEPSGGADWEEVEQALSAGSELSGEALYALLAAAGLDYGASFRGVTRALHREGMALAEIELPPSLAGARDGQRLHPAVLDAAFHAVALALPPAAGEGLVLPVGIDRLSVHAAPGRRLRSWVRLRDDAGDGDELRLDVRLCGDDGAPIADAQGLRMRRLSLRSAPALDDWLYELRWKDTAALDLPECAPDLSDQGWLVFADASGVSAGLIARAESAGARCIAVRPGETFSAESEARYRIDPEDPAHFERLLGAAFPSGSQPLRKVVHLWNLDAPEVARTTPETLAAATRLGLGSLLHAVQALGRSDGEGAPRLCLVTAGAQPVRAGDPVSPAQAPAWGLARSIALEHAELRCLRVDLPAGAEADPGALDALFDELRADRAEDQVALRDGKRHVQRLARYAGAKVAAPAQPLSAAGERPYRLEIDAPGVLDRLVWRETARREPGPDEIELRVAASGLNFKDVLLAMGVVPSPFAGLLPLGSEVAGVVTRVGTEVQGFEVGQEVVAVAPFGFARFATTSACLAAPKPGALSFAQAAGLPIAFLTASFALEEAARLGRGERVLIHAASGGVGLAALQIARARGAEVFATAGSEEKRAYLRGLGVEHVMDSRSLDFAGEVQQATRGRGVDVVLNCLSGDAVLRGLEALGTSGRFVEIGIRDIYAGARLPLWPFHRGLSYHAIDLSRLTAERPLEVGRRLRSLLERVERGELEALPTAERPAREVVSAFQHMAAARHVGKLALLQEEPEALPIEAAPASAPAVRPDATYLVTGGLGGLGLTVARWLVERGATHLVLVGRSAPTGSAAAAVAELGERARVDVHNLDVADPAAVERLVAAIRAELPPLRGVVHAAGVLRDGVLMQMDTDALRAVLAPKVAGAWNLHAATLDEPLDFFVMFSGAASMLGSPGQGNYCAANAFLDALAHQRRSEQRCALSINWGPWSEVGLAAAQANRGERLALLGLESLSPAQGIAALERVLREPVAQIGVMPLHLERWFRAFALAAEIPLLADLAEGTSSASAPPAESEVAREIRALESEQARLRRLDAWLREQIGLVLKMDPKRIDADRSVGELGFDSLMALELKNRLETGLGITLSATLLFNHPTLKALVPALARRMGVLSAAAPAAPAPEAPAPGDGAPDDEIDALSDDEASTALEAELEEIVRNGLTEATS
jgi:acyl transferase domain-containing protein/NAD(P)-dependent dehydrogenase (short-subunit alcohol dehydrogenase family)/acyl carrier protein